MKEKEDEYRPVSNRINGLFKVGAAALYWSFTLSSGLVFPGLLALAGSAIAVTGLVVKTIGEKTDLRKMEKFGADIIDSGVKACLSPIWVSCYAIDGIGNFITGSKKNRLSRWDFNSKAVEERHAFQEQKMAEAMRQAQTQEQSPHQASQINNRDNKSNLNTVPLPTVNHNRKTSPQRRV